MQLQHLSISGFRGVGSGLDLTLSPRTIIYGPNGSGKSSLLQSIAWALYGKLPLFSGGVFTREDALVNDFMKDSQADVRLALSDGTRIVRKRRKQGATTRGPNPLSLSLPGTDPQAAVEELLGLNSEEFYAAVFLHQETIRDFLTTTPEKRSATVDRMIGTYLLRTLIKQVDPKVPAKAIDKLRGDIEHIDSSLAQASVLNREVLQAKKEQEGDPEILPQVLASAMQKLAPVLAELGLPVRTTLDLESLSASLSEARRAQLTLVGELTQQVGQLNNLKQRYTQAAETNWQPLFQQKAQHGDPAELPGLLQSIHAGLAPVLQKMELSQSGNTVPELDQALVTVRRKQPALISQLERRVADLNGLNERRQQALRASQSGLADRKEKWGEPEALPLRLSEVHRDLSPVLEELALPVPQKSLTALEESLASARRAQPVVIGRLERQAGQLLALKEQYLSASREVIESVTIPSEMAAKQEGLKRQVDTLTREISTLSGQLDDRRLKEQQAEALRGEVQPLPELLAQVSTLNQELERLEAAGKQGDLYNQAMLHSRQYLEQARPDHCPVCKHALDDLNGLLETLASEAPADVEKMRQDYKMARKHLDQQQALVDGLKGKQQQLNLLERVLENIPAGLEGQIGAKELERQQAADRQAQVSAEIVQIEARIRQAEEKRRFLQAIVSESEKALGKPAVRDLEADLEKAAAQARQQAARLGEFDFESLTDRLFQARQLYEIGQEELRLQQQLEAVQAEIRQQIGFAEGDDIASRLEAEIQSVRDRGAEIQSLDFQPLTDELDRARQLVQIQQEESRLQQALRSVQAEIHQILGREVDNDELSQALQSAFDEKQAQAIRVNELDLRPAEADLQHASRLEEIRRDEEQLRQMETNYRVANREKARLKHRIHRLVELRDALQDIAETTKAHQENIVAGVLSNLDLHHYYRQLDPHPVYSDLQIEPELTSAGTYQYWIKAVTSDYTYGTYVQTRFSTAQANCAAIAIFLAVNQHLSKKLETMILDDPSQSMDAAHKQRLAQTLAGSSRQVIVATEDPEMYGYLKDCFDTPLVYELQPWTVEGSVLG